MIICGKGWNIFFNILELAREPVPGEDIKVLNIPCGRIFCDISVVYILHYIGISVTVNFFRVSFEKLSCDW